jgi:hypothetical protein
MSMVGYAPVHINQSGDIIADLGAMDDEGGALFRRNPERRSARINRRIGRLQSRLGPAVANDVDDTDDEPILDLYQQATALGAVTENQFDGLGSATLAAAGTGSINDTLNRNVWAKGFVLDSDDPPSIGVTSITVAGLPVNIGSGSAPLSMFAANSTRFGIQFGRRPILVGQRVVVNFVNLDASSHFVQGALVCDELNPYMTQQLMERVLVGAAVDMYGKR